MKENTIITISREYGSGGKKIGKLLAETLNIPFYDKEIIDLAAKESGFAAEFIENEEQKMTSSLIFNIATNMGILSGGNPSGQIESLADQIYFAESKVIRKIAKVGSSVIVGRCADYILEDDFTCMKVFIHADLSVRCDQAVKEYGVSADEVERLVKETDKARVRHYQHYSGRIWGDMRNYHLSIDSGKFGINESAEIIKKALELV